jgi:hypothetical protein
VEGNELPFHGALRLQQWRAACHSFAEAMAEWGWVWIVTIFSEF